MQTLDLLRGTQSVEVDLGIVPYLSRLGPNVGTLEIVADAGGRVVDLNIALVSPRRVLLRELDRIAAEADWDVPVAEIRRTSTPRFMVDLALGDDAKRRLAEVEIRLEASELPRTVSALRPLLKEAHFRVANIREVIET